MRLPDYDYSQPGAYFITIVARGRECLFGKIQNAEMQMNSAGLVPLFRTHYNELAMRDPVQPSITRRLLRRRRSQ